LSAPERTAQRFCEALESCPARHRFGMTRDAVEPGIDDQAGAVRHHPMADEHAWASLPWLPCGTAGRRVGFAAWVPVVAFSLPEIFGGVIPPRPVPPHPAAH